MTTRRTKVTQASDLPGPSKGLPKVHEPKKSSQRRAVSANGSKTSTLGNGAPRRRLRWPEALPKPTPDGGLVPYAKSRPELKGLTEAHATRMVLDSKAWQEVIKPVLDRLDRDRAVPGKEKPIYTSEELESVLYYQRLCGYSSYKRARNAIAGDRDEARQLLGFDKPRNRGRRIVKLRDGVPSEATVSRHRMRLPERRRRELYEELERRILEEHLEDPDFRAELRILNADGTKIQTHYTAPIIDPKTGREVNSNRITAPEAGYVPHSASPDKAGHGWNLVSITTSSALPVAHAIVPLQAEEPTVLLDLLRGPFTERIFPSLESILGPNEVAVLSADGGFNSQANRHALREISILENVHHVSHADKPESKDNAAAKDAVREAFVGYDNWFANGHRELICACGQGITFRRAGRRGRLAFARVEGSCRNCGSITITSGDWRRAQNPKRWVRIDPRNPRDKSNLAMGNPLSFNDPIANEYGTRRFGHNEGFHGALQSRFGLIKDKRWFRRLDEAKIATSMVFVAMHVLAMEQRRRARQAQPFAQAKAPPALAA